jgi:alkylglycerol monooxygenase
VHHAINPIYLDKNYGQIFIIWDKLFGTYQEELPEEPCMYGVTRPVRTWNPIRINFMHLWLLIRDAWHATKWKDKIRIWFMPLGWRPADVANRFPVYKIEDVHNYEKFDTPASPGLLAWVMIQMALLLAFISYLFANVAAIGAPHIFYYGAFIFLTVYSYTELMDRRPVAFYWELLRCLVGIYLLFMSPDWFGAVRMFEWLPLVLKGYLFISPLVSAVFCYGFLRQPEASGTSR